MVLKRRHRDFGAHFRAIADELLRNQKVTFLCAEELLMLAEAQSAVEAKCTNAMLPKSTSDVTPDVRLLLVLYAGADFKWATLMSFCKNLSEI